MCELSKSEKERYCEVFAEHLPELRRILRMTQERFGDICGYSRIRVSNIETKREKLSWHQLMAFSLVCLSNVSAREYIMEHKVFDEKFFNYIMG